MNAFNMALTECGLSDLGFVGCRYTWSNNRLAPRTVSCRLDRVCANQSARLQFPTAQVSHIEQPGSDHIPILLELERIPNPISGLGLRRRPFRFESLWVRKDDCKAIVRKVWEDDSGLDQSYTMVHNGEICRAELLQWSKSTNPNREIDRTQKRIMVLKRCVQTEEVRAELAGAE